MFEGLYFNLVRNIDDAMRLILPPEVGDVKGAEFAIARPDEKFYHIYLLDRVNSLVVELRERLLTCQSRELRDSINADLNALCACILKTSKADAQKRILLPPEFEGYRGKSVNIIGMYDYIRLYPDEKDYKEYLSLVRKNNLFK